MKKLVLTICLFLTIPCAAQTIAVDDDGVTDFNNIQPATRQSAQTTSPEYAPNEIIVKFRKDVANTLNVKLAEGTSNSELKLTDSLDRLNKKYKVRKAEAIFKDFKKTRQRIKALLKKDKAILTKKDRRILRRVMRAPKNVTVPDLDRIYKIQVELEPGQSLEEVVAAYKNNPAVEYAELNYVVSINLTPNDPYYSDQWSLNKIDAPDAWARSTGSSEVIVAVVDTGVDYTHGDLDDNMWVNSGEIAGNGVDDDGNGYVDDIYGYDFLNYDADPKDDNGHGTHCSGIIAAEGNNALDITGVCWDGRIMALKFLNSDGDGYTSDAVTAFYYAVANGADVISNSWGGGDYLQSMQDAIDYAYSQGVIIVAAAGNDNLGLPYYPAYYEHMIAVAATDSDDQKASFSNYGDWVDIAAPGLDILSLRKGGATVYSSGTSAACPHVAGVCALLLSIHPKVQIDVLERALRESTDPIDPGICSSGRLNAYQATLEIFSSRGRVFLDSDFYSSSALIGIELLDTDLKGNGTQQVIVESDGGNCETVLLTETPSLGIFSGTISIGTDHTNIEDGILQLSHGEVITVTYIDSDDGTGNPAIATDSATADFEGPVTFNIQVGVPGCQPKISFATDEPAKGSVLCGLACGGPYTIEVTDWKLKTSHATKLTGVFPETDYFFIIEATDVAGNKTVDDNGGQCYSFTTIGAGSEIYVPSQCPTIQEAVDNCWDGMVVWVADGTYTGEGNCDIDFEGRAITVRGENGPNDCIIDCNGTEAKPHRAFHFHSGEDNDSIVEGFTIKNGYEFFGAGIYCEYSSPMIINCTFTRNSAQWGGGISCYCSSAVVSNCTFTGNSAFEGGAIDTCGYGRGHCGSCYPVIENCLITCNRTSGSGGGINSDIWSKPTISDCTIATNFAGVYGGGGISIFESSPTITNCIITDNFTESDGGGILNWYVWHSHLEGSTINNCIITNNTAVNWGGGVCAGRYGRMTMTNCAISGNSAQFGGGAYGEFAHISVKNCTITGNKTNRNGSGLSHCHVSIANCIIWNNIAQEDSPQIVRSAEPTYSCIQDWSGGGVGNITEEPCLALDTDYHIMPDSPCIDAGTNTPFDGLPTTDIEGKPRTLDGDGNGTAVTDMGVCEYHPNNPSIAVSANCFSYVQNCGEKPAPQTLLIRNCGTGALYWQIAEDCPWLEPMPTSGISTDQINEVTLTVDSNGLSSGCHNCILTVLDPNAANSPVTIQVVLHVGATLHVPDQFPTIQAAINAAVNYDVILVDDGIYTGDGNRDLDFHGKPIIVKSANGPESCIIDCNDTGYDPHRACYFHNHETADSIIDGFTLINGNVHDGGGIYCKDSSPTIRNCTITGNIASEFGGGILCDARMGDRTGWQSSPRIIDCTVSGNTASEGGGICCWGYSSPAITNCNIADNKAGRGGGIWCEGSGLQSSSPRIINCTVSGNTAGEGGGIYCRGRSSPIISDSNIISNIANWDQGGGISCHYTGDGVPTFNNCTISGNYSQRSGGGLYNCHGPISNCVISGNFVQDGGGGGMCSCNGPITNCVISGNFAQDGGGGMDSCNGPITNCVISGNFAQDGGGGMDSCNGAISNCVISGNFTELERTRGGGLYNCNGQITNCTITGNLASYGGGMCSIDAVTNCIIWNNSEPQIGGSATITFSDVEGGCEGEGNIDTTPCFIHPGYWDFNSLWIEGDYHLLPDSPCIDAGDPNYIAEPNETDLDGNPRVIGDRIDMGAYEFSPPIQAEMKFTPQTLNCNSKGNWVKAHLVLPEGFLPQDMDVNKPVVAKLSHMRIISESIKLLGNDDGPVKLEIAFDRQAFCDLLTNDDSIATNGGSLEIRVVGYLTTGRYFSGTDTIRIKPRR